MNLPNQLTVTRFALTVVFLAALLSNLPFSESAALILFIVASITDYWDGVIARRDKLVTNFGILMDPLADKILTCSAFIVFVEVDPDVAAWMVVIIVAREFAITGLRLLAASKQIHLAAEGYGKHKTISQIVAIILTLFSLSYPEWGQWAETAFEPWVPWLKRLSLWLAVLLTFVSGGLYLWKNRRLYLNDL